MTANCGLNVNLTKFWKRLPTVTSFLSSPSQVSAKSVACHKRLTAHVEAGGFGLVIPHEIIAGASSLEQAIDATLRLLYPSLVPGVGSEARALASERTPLLMVVEDVNKSGQPHPSRCDVDPGSNIQQPQP